MHVSGSTQGLSRSGLRAGIPSLLSHLLVKARHKVSLDSGGGEISAS